MEITSHGVTQHSYVHVVIIFVKEKNHIIWRGQLPHLTQHSYAYVDIIFEKKKLSDNMEKFGRRWACPELVNTDKQKNRQTASQKISPEHWGKLKKVHYQEI